LDAGMAADPLLHVVVKLQGTEDLLCYLKAATLAVQVFNTCKIKAKCQEGWHCAFSWYLVLHSS